MISKLSLNHLFAKSIIKTRKYLPINQSLKSKNNLTTLIKYDLSQKDQRFLRFIDFDANYFNQVPLLLKPLDPFMIYTKNLILELNTFLSLPWWSILMFASVLIRLTIFPLVIIQMKRMSKLGPISPVFVLIKDTWKHSQLSKYEKMKTILSLYRIISKEQKIRLSTIFIYNMAYYPMLISMIFSIRKLLSEPQVSNTIFLHISNLGDIDPYYILPTLTIGLYYWNFQRFITKQNKNTLISKIRTACQYFLIVWYPFLCCWPAGITYSYSNRYQIFLFKQVSNIFLFKLQGIVLYMCTNALISIYQSNLMKKPWFLSKIAPELVFYNFMLTTVQYDKGISDSVIQSIKTGEENFKQKAINQIRLFEQTQIMIKKLNKENKQNQQDNGEKKKKQQQNKNNNINEVK